MQGSLAKILLLCVIAQNLKHSKKGQINVKYNNLNDLIVISLFLLHKYFLFICFSMFLLIDLPCVHL